MTQSRAQRRHDRELVIASRTSLAKNALNYGTGNKIVGGYLDTHRPGGSCGNPHCSICAYQKAEKHEAIKEQRRQSRKVERLTTNEDD